MLQSVWDIVNPLYCLLGAKMVRPTFSAARVSTRGSQGRRLVSRGARVTCASARASCRREYLSGPVLLLRDVRGTSENPIGAHLSARSQDYIRRPLHCHVSKLPARAMTHASDATATCLPGCYFTFRVLRLINPNLERRSVRLHFNLLGLWCASHIPC